MDIYLVSLESDVARRDRLKESFSSHYAGMKHIKAVDGRKLSAKDYYEKTIPYFIKTGKTMSPSELGCTLSHIRALDLFLETGEPYALILEDDIIGNDQSLKKISRLAETLTQNSLLICGGQEGLISRRYQLGKLALNGNAYRLARFSYQHILRTCCYVVTRKTAKIILDESKRNITLADSWDRHFKGKPVDIYFSNQLSHPEDLSDSHIEKDRALFKKNNFLDKVMSFGLFERIFRKLKNEIIVIFFRLNGYTRLK